MITSFYNEITMGRTKRQKRNIKLFTALIVLVLLAALYLLGSTYVGLMLIK